LMVSNFDQLLFVIIAFGIIFLSKLDAMHSFASFKHCRSSVDHWKCYYSILKTSNRTILNTNFHYFKLVFGSFPLDQHEQWCYWWLEIASVDLYLQLQRRYLRIFKNSKRGFLNFTPHTFKFQSAENESIFDIHTITSLMSDTVMA
jgi:hypothetical protein